MLIVKLFETEQYGKLEDFCKDMYMNFPIVQIATIHILQSLLMSQKVKETNFLEYCICYNFYSIKMRGDY
jgi:hypothetical protein